MDSQPLLEVLGGLKNLSRVSFSNLILQDKLIEENLNPLLTSLIVKDCKLAHIDLKNFPRLTHIDLSRNFLKEVKNIPGTVQHLNLSFNLLNSVSLSPQNKLVYLDLSFNALSKSIKAVLHAVEKTDQVTSKACNIKGYRWLTDSIKNIPNLISLDLSNNRITRKILNQILENAVDVKSDLSQNLKELLS